MTRFSLPALVLAAAALPAADLTGVWHLVPARSDFGRAAAPKAQEIAVRQEGRYILVRSTIEGENGTRTAEYKLDTSGKETENVIRGNRISSTATWRGDLLHVKSKTSVENNEVKTIDQWQIDGDGAVLTIYRSATLPNGELEQKFVYEKNLGKR